MEAWEIRFIRGRKCSKMWNYSFRLGLFCGKLGAACECSRGTRVVSANQFFFVLRLCTSTDTCSNRVWRSREFSLSTSQECVCWWGSSCPQFPLHINELALGCASSKQITVFTVNFSVCRWTLMWNLYPERQGDGGRSCSHTGGRSRLSQIYCYSCQQ